MGNRNQSEYNNMRNIIQQYTDEQNHLSHEKAELEDRLWKLRSTQAALEGKLSVLSGLRIRVMRLAEEHADWRGLHADQCLKSCCNGQAKDAYDHVIYDTEYMIQKIEDAICEIRCQIFSKEHRMLEINERMSHLTDEYNS